MNCKSGPLGPIFAVEGRGLRPRSPAAAGPCHPPVAGKQAVRESASASRPSGTCSRPLAPRAGVGVGRGCRGQPCLLARGARRAPHPKVLREARPRQAPGLALAPAARGNPGGAPRRPAVPPGPALGSRLGAGGGRYGHGARAWSEPALVLPGGARHTPGLKSLWEETPLPLLGLDSNRGPPRQTPPSRPRPRQTPAQQTPPMADPAHGRPPPSRPRPRQTPPTADPAQQTPPTAGPAQQTPPMADPAHGRPRPADPTHSRPRPWQTPPTADPAQKTPPMADPALQTPPRADPAHDRSRP
ncbi:proline-rich protein 2-like [Choloepus didactylus]|uniref:proline-rich protein 2-like n=1 Tax=Choloepus didactylus TaxID=27675 RepID=UPI0018A09B18|nr:proline-rich protein 2-like [Choloepus didactylus]